MTPEKEAELFAKLDLMLELYRRLDTDMRDMRSDIKEVGERVARLEGPIEEQSKVLQIALAGRQPRRPSAAA